MNIFEVLNREAGARNLRFLVIGAHALNAYGYSRETADVDLLISKEDQEAWRGIFQSLGYSVFHFAGSFLQLAPPAEEAWPVDLMLVNEATLNKMLEQSQRLHHLNTEIPIPGIQHLLALKIHSLKHAGIHRYMKDFQDVLGLLECAKIDPASQDIKNLFEKHGTMELYEKILRSFRPD